MYNHLFNQTPHSTYKLAQILNVSFSSVISFRKSKNVNYERLFEFMRKLEIKEFEYQNNQISINIKIK